MKKIASILLFGLIFWGCKKPAVFEYRGIQNIRLAQLPADSMAISATIQFFNPNNYVVQLKKIDADVYVNDQFITHYKIDTLIKIPANSPFVYTCSIGFETNKILGNMIAAVFSKKILLHIKGTTRIGRSGLFVNVPFDFSSKQDLHF